MSKLQSLQQLVAIQNAMNIQAHGEEWLDNAKTDKFDFRTSASVALIDTVKGFEGWWENSPANRHGAAINLANSLQSLLSVALADAAATPAALNDALFETVGQRAFDRYEEHDAALQVDPILIRQQFRRLQSAVNTGRVGEIWIEFFATLRCLNISLELLAATYQAAHLLAQYQAENEGQVTNFNDGRSDALHFVAWIDDNLENFNAKTAREWLAQAYAPVKVEVKKEVPVQTTTLAPQQAVQEDDSAKNDGQDSTAATTEPPATTTPAPAARQKIRR